VTFKGGYICDMAVKHVKYKDLESLQRVPELQRMFKESIIKCLCFYILALASAMGHRYREDIKWDGPSVWLFQCCSYDHWRMEWDFQISFQTTVGNQTPITSSSCCFAVLDVLHWSEQMLAGWHPENSPQTFWSLDWCVKWYH